MTATPSDRDILYEVVTNGRWSEGEQRGEWMITKEVYETARDALASRSLEREAERTVDTTKLNAGQLVQRIMRVMDHNDAGSGGIAKLAEAIAAGILDLPANYWTSAVPVQSGDVADDAAKAIERLREQGRYSSRANNSATQSKEYPPEWFQCWKDADAIEARIAALTAATEVSPEMIATLKRLDAEPPEAWKDFIWNDFMTYLDEGPSPAPTPLDKTARSSIIHGRVARLICYETCRAGLCKDAERCCGGSQSPIRISEERAKELLAPLLGLEQALEDALTEAREVIEPFAKMADELDKWVQSNPAPKTPNYTASVGDLRRARAWWERNSTGGDGND